MFSFIYKLIANFQHSKYVKIQFNKIISIADCDLDKQQ